MSSKAKTPAKSAPAKKPVPAAKTPAKPARGAETKSAAPAKAAATPAAPRAANRGAPAVGVVATTRIEATPAAAATSVAPPIPPRTVPARPVADPKDIAAAHEYLTIRSATRSEEPVVINGRPLPTEEQLLKMPEADYMNADQLAFFRHRLQRLERELLANADETTEHLRETVIVPDPADRATIEEEHALELRTRDRERKLLKKVQASLARIDGGDYGFCEETGDPIGIPRLLARPTATLSLEAQQRREMKQKLYGD
ncbi:MAG TPA: RNA polymerase-binding protein DksA [Burkholderiaceae bacterium]|nr:RNA polymerase-binding protein DksA [Burkholderiaceae bacterium]